MPWRRGGFACTVNETEVRCLTVGPHLRRERHPAAPVGGPGSGATSRGELLSLIHSSSKGRSYPRAPIGNAKDSPHVRRISPCQCVDQALITNQLPLSDGDRRTTMLEQIVSFEIG